jgi:hypothetical protein
VLVHEGLGHSSGDGDVVHGRCRIPTFGKELEGDSEELTTPSVGGEPPMTIGRGVSLARSLISA